MIIGFDAFHELNYLNIAWLISTRLIISYTSLVNTTSATGSCSAPILISASFLAANLKLVYDIMLKTANQAQTRVETQSPE